MILRCIKLADYVIETKATVRDTAKVFGLSKSTVHKDITERLETVDCHRFCCVKDVLEFNLSERHIRGGEATKIKYLKEDKEEIK